MRDASGVRRRARERYAGFGAQHATGFPREHQIVFPEPAGPGRLGPAVARTAAPRRLAIARAARPTCRRRACGPSARVAAAARALRRRSRRRRRTRPARERGIAASTSVDREARIARRTPGAPRGCAIASAASTSRELIAEIARAHHLALPVAEALERQLGMCTHGSTSPRSGGSRPPPGHSAASRRCRSVRRSLDHELQRLDAVDALGAVENLEHLGAIDVASERPAGSVRPAAQRVEEPVQRRDRARTDVGLVQPWKCRDRRAHRDFDVLGAEYLDAGADDPPAGQVARDRGAESAARRRPRGAGVRDDAAP